MGNISDFHLIVANLVEIGEDFCFTTYKINKTAESNRKIYYLNCGCDQVGYSMTPIGDLYTSISGLHSAAFKISYLFELLEITLQAKSKKARIFVQDLSDMGYIIYVKGISNIPVSSLSSEKTPEVTLNRSEFQALGMEDLADFDLAVN